VWEVDPSGVVPPRNLTAGAGRASGISLRVVDLDPDNRFIDAAVPLTLRGFSEATKMSGYFRAKMAQENLIKASGIPFTIVHATQFFEFTKGIAQSGTDGSTIRLSPILMQPMAAGDVAAAVADAAVADPVNGMMEVAGPDQIRQDELVRQFLSATGDTRKVITDDHTRYFGIEVNDQSLLPGDNPRLGTTRFEDWLKRSKA
ncbi:MAG: hypothetical protein ABR611_12135, partial [Chthoniobacterales bacterium]